MPALNRDDFDSNAGFKSTKLDERLSMFPCLLLLVAEVGLREPFLIVLILY
jgi:hypothetical protein